MKVNVFESLKISCFATKKEIEASFLKSCGDLDETEEKIKKAIEYLSQEKETDVEPAFIRRQKESRKEELLMMEKTFQELGMQYETIMDGDINKRFEYIVQNMNLYNIAGVSIYDSVEDISKKIEARISNCFLREQEFKEDESGENATKNEIEILARIKELMEDPERKKAYDESLRKREEETKKDEEESARRIVKFTRRIQSLNDADIDRGLNALFAELPPRNYRTRL